MLRIHEQHPADLILQTGIELQPQKVVHRHRAVQRLAAQLVGIDQRAPRQGFPCDGPAASAAMRAALDGKNGVTH